MRRVPLRLSSRVREAVTTHLEAAYPREGCGLLLGQEARGTRRVLRAEPAENRWRGSLPGYRVDPDRLRRALSAEDSGESGLSVLGFYHSHPDGMALPSRRDLQLAWPWYDYLIVSVESGRARRLRGWRLSGAGTRFEERVLIS